MRFLVNYQQLLAVVEGRIVVMDTFDEREVVTWKTGMKAGAPAMEASCSAGGLYAISGALLCVCFPVQLVQFLIYYFLSIPFLSTVNFGFSSSDLTLASTNLVLPILSPAFLNCMGFTAWLPSSWKAGAPALEASFFLMASMPSQVCFPSSLTCSWYSFL
jgi:hypothetical protein